MAKDEQRQTTTARAVTEPYRPAVPALNDLVARIGGGLGNIDATAAETGALDRLAARAGADHPWAARFGVLADDLFKGGPDRAPIVADAYAAYKQGLAPTAAGHWLDPGNNPAIRPWLDAMSEDVTNRVNATFSAGGRDLSPAHAGTLAKGIAQAQAPVLADLFNQERGRQLGAIGDLYRGGLSTASALSGLDQTALGNRQAGVNVANAALSAADAGDNALLAIEARRRGLPLQNLSALAQLLVPIAGLGRTTESHETKTTEMRQDPTRAILGGVLGGLSLLGGNPMGLLGVGQAAAGLAGGGAGRVGAPLNILPPALQGWGDPARGGLY
jgi:hypothetical protein